MKLIGSSTLAAGAVALSSLACGGSSEPRSGEVGSSVTVAIAPLEGAAFAVACFDLRLTSELGELWSKGDPGQSFLEGDDDTLCSDASGLAGGISWIGACDARPEADTDPSTPATIQNTVTLWFDGVYNADKDEEALGFHDPCGEDGCSIDFDCDPNADTRADFSFTVLSDATVGFFDIAVRFDSIFCSAKYDDCYSDNTEVSMFSGPDGPHKTGVFAMACTGPVGTDVNLHYGNLAIVCNEATFPIDPTVDRATEAPSNPTGSSLTYNVYRDQMTVDCDGATCNGLYWNLAFDLTDLPATGTCTLAFSATASNSSAFVSGLPTASTYPFIDVDAIVKGGPDACQRNPLNGDESAVATTYHGDFGLPPVRMCASYDGTTVTTLNHSDCTSIPEPAPLGNVLRAYTGVCNPPGSTPENNNYHVDNPIECPAGTRCELAGSYGYGTCIPNDVQACDDQRTCGVATVELSFSRSTTGLAITIPAGSYVSSPADADGDANTGYQYNFKLLEDVVFLESTSAVVGHAILERDSQMDPADLGNVAPGTLTVIGASGVADDYGDIAVTNENAASGGASGLFCIPGYGAQVGMCVSTGHPQACDPYSSEPQCPSGSLCEDNWNLGLGQCRAQAAEGARCSTGKVMNGRHDQCQPGLVCAFDPVAQDWESTCRRPAGLGDTCLADYDTDIPLCGAGLYCRPESTDYATCSPRKGLGEICSVPMANSDRRWQGNCDVGLLCAETFDPNDAERRCVANPLLDHGEPCWTEGEEAQRKCKGHCNVDVSPNPFATIGASGVCAADVGEGAPCHAGEFGDDDYNGYCLRGLYCNEEGLGQNMSGHGTCLRIAGIGSICDIESDAPNAMCANDQICGARLDGVAFMNGDAGYCVDRGCGNNAVEQARGFEGEAEIGYRLVVWAGTCVNDSAYCDDDTDCEVGDTCAINGPHQDWAEAAGELGLDLPQGMPHGLAVGDALVVQFDGASPPHDRWQTRTVSEVVNAWTVKVSGTIPAGASEAEILGGGYEQCDDGRNNCDTLINGQPVCPCSTLCTSN